MYYIGFDIGSSSIKVALVNATSGEQIGLLNEPKSEMEIISTNLDWAEQDPNSWWEYASLAARRLIEKTKIDPDQINGVGISYQMHGLVALDKHGNPVRNAIIWCDSRAVEIGNRAFEALGADKCRLQLLNSPGNFTASKLKWVKEQEPECFEKIYKIMLPGDFIAYKLSGKITTTKHGLSEGILWDFKKDQLADWVLDYYEISKELIPEIVENFSNQGTVTIEASKSTRIPVGTPIFYRAGDQPNNALSLNVFNHGEVAATGGTSGVLYSVSKHLETNESIRINNFAHVNYSNDHQRIGKLLCINGAGIAFRWLKNLLGSISYEQMNKWANKAPIGSDGLMIIPFGNGAERMLNNKNTNARIIGLNFNIHHKEQLCRAVLEGISFSFVYGMEILKKDKASVKVIRAGNDNLFRSEIFGSSVATLIGHNIEIYNTTGAVGAARACGLKDGDFDSFGSKVLKNDHVMTYHPEKRNKSLVVAYNNWKKELNIILKKE